MDILSLATSMSKVPELRGCLVEVPSWSDIFAGGRDRILIFSEDRKKACCLIPNFSYWGFLKFVFVTNPEFQKSLGLRIQSYGLFHLLTDGMAKVTLGEKSWKVWLRKRSNKEAGHRWTLEAEEIA